MKSEYHHYVVFHETMMLPGFVCLDGRSQACRGPRVFIDEQMNMTRSPRGQ